MCETRTGCTRGAHRARCRAKRVINQFNPILREPLSSNGFEFVAVLIYSSANTVSHHPRTTRLSTAPPTRANHFPWMIHFKRSTRLYLWRDLHDTQNSQTVFACFPALRPARFRFLSGGLCLGVQFLLRRRKLRNRPRYQHLQRRRSKLQSQLQLHQYLLFHSYPARCHNCGFGVFE